MSHPHQAAVAALVTALAKLGYGEEQCSIREIPEGGIVFELRPYLPASVSITVEDYWAYPTMSCYFVNMKHPGGDFSFHAGTPFVEQALFNLGEAVGHVNHIRLKEDKAGTA